MRIKTFIATYMLFLCVMFSAVAIVSAYLTNSQVNILREKSISQYRSIATSLVRDMGALQVRNFSDYEFEAAVHNILIGYQIYYAGQDVFLGLHHWGRGAHEPELVFLDYNRRRFIQISGTLPPPFSAYHLDYSLEITQNIVDMRGVQNMMLISVAILSAIAAVVLYFVLAAIFKPFSIVASASRKIAGGRFGERIHVKGNSEISRLAQDFNDMAERIERQIQILEEEAVAKQQFVDNFAHEIRTPLTSIYGYAEYMQKASLDEEETIESTEYIMSESRHMRNIANSLLELAVLRDYVPVKTEINLPQLFDDVKKTMENHLREREARLEINIGAETIMGQEDLIKSLVLNLCTNALKACVPGRGVIALDAAQAGKKVIISVSDNGCGIPAESLSKIMEPFYRVDKSRSREFGGTGLGLTLCSQIAKVHGAEMVIESAVGEGTKVETIFTTS
ncbi:MAG: HAMP domain-containing histidine kinase [Firmicutes bacterium]|nr:HAMP domain-containing histidine kinase [Bacillota bacterium]